jgi:hypothetical protein
MGHEICYALGHIFRLEDERWKGDLGEVHADSVGEGKSFDGITRRVSVR